jgi:hypothetical protein
MPCSQDDCPADPVWRPALDLRRHAGETPTRLHFCRLGYCSEHQKSLQVDTFLSDEGSSKISKFMRENGKPAPDRSLTRLAWEPLTPAEIAAMAPSQDHTRSSAELAF